MNCSGQHLPSSKWVTKAQSENILIGFVIPREMPNICRTNSLGLQSNKRKKIWKHHSLSLKLCPCALTENVYERREKSRQTCSKSYLLALPEYRYADKMLHDEKQFLSHLSLLVSRAHQYFDCWNDSAKMSSTCSDQMHGTREKRSEWEQKARPLWWIHLSVEHEHEKALSSRIS